MYEDDTNARAYDEELTMNKRRKCNELNMNKMKNNRLDSILRVFNLLLCVMMVMLGMAQNCHITGRVNIPGLQKKSVTMTNLNTGATLGKTTIVDSSFTFDNDVAEPFVVMLLTDPQTQGQRNYHYLRFIAEQGSIYCDLVTDSLSGTPLNDRFHQFSNHCNKEVSVLNAQFSQLRQRSSMPADEREELVQAAEARKNSLFSYLKDTYEENKTNAIGALVMEIYLDYNAEVNYEEVLQMLEGSAPVVTTYKYLAEKLAKLETLSHTAVGKPFIDLDLTDFKTKKSVKLSKVISGKVALIDFWASWCRPCRAEIPHIAQIHEKYGGKDFVVISLNVWDKHDAQAKAIKDLNMTWMQLTDATKISTDTYGIEGIPQIMLIDKDGTIIARDLRGNEIEQAVKRALGK